jgi:hypothetical protein
MSLHSFPSSSTSNFLYDTLFGALLPFQLNLSSHIRLPRQLHSPIYDRPAIDRPTCRTLRAVGTPNTATTPPMGSRPRNPLPPPLLHRAGAKSCASTCPSPKSTHGLPVPQRLSPSPRHLSPARRRATRLASSRRMATPCLGVFLISSRRNTLCCTCSSAASCPTRSPASR